MYSTCLFCRKSLGANDTFETFPVGRRIAVDAAKGRLWVVCKECERWNLSPLDERWEAIELAERLYRDTRRRVSTDEIGLAKLRDGTELVRIGTPQRPEFAAWRYGDQFGRRRRRQLLIAGGGVAALGALVAGGAIAAGGIGGIGWLIARAGRAIVLGDPETVVAKIPTETRGVVSVRRRHLAETTLGRADDGSLLLDLRFKDGHGEFTGREAERIASIVVPKVNRFGGSKDKIVGAVQEIEARGGSEGYLDALSHVSPTYTRPHLRATWRGWGTRHERWSMSHGLFGIPVEHRLALEMALHEEAERRAMAGELEELERAWREAEEIAGIADDLFVPKNVEAAFQALKGKTFPFARS